MSLNFQYIDGKYFGQHKGNRVKVGPEKDGSAYVCVNGVFFTQPPASTPDACAQHLEEHFTLIYNKQSYKPVWQSNGNNKWKLHYQKDTYIVGLNRFGLPYIWRNGEFITPEKGETMEVIKVRIVNNLNIKYPEQGGVSICHTPIKNKPDVQKSNLDITKPDHLDRHFEK